MAERSGQRGRGKARFGDQEAARRFLVEPVHQARLLPLGVAHHFQHLVDVPRGAGTALHRKPCRLVQHHHVVILVKRHLLQRRERLGCRLPRDGAAARGASSFSGGMRTLCPSSQPVLAVGALAVDAQLAFANDALDVGERQAGKARLQKAVDAHVVLVRRHDHGLHFRRQRRRLVILGGRRDDRLWRAGRGGAQHAGRLAAGRCPCGRSACEPRYGRAPFGRSPALRFGRGFRVRRLMMGGGSRTDALR